MGDSTLVGDLYIVGGGDPTIGSTSDCAQKLSETFSAWAAIIRSAGINRIDGRIIGDPRFFRGVPYCTSWQADDLGWYYGAGPTGLSFFENTQTFYVTPGASEGVAPFVRPHYPDTPWMHFNVSAVTTDPGTSNELSYVNSSFVPEGDFTGTFPVDRKGYTFEGTNRFGAYTCAYYFHNYLKKNGIVVTKGYGDVAPAGYIRTDLSSAAKGSAAPSQNLLCVIGSTSSPRLADIASDTNHQSDNFYAETLLHTLGAIMRGDSQYSACSDAASEALSSMGLDATSINWCDGSGLSRHNFISPEFFVRFLKAMARSSVFPEYFASLPQPGGDGTLKNRMKSAPDATKERIHMKSGSMDGVRCFSGYITSRDGNPDHTIVFSVLTNNVTASSYTVYGILDDIILGLAAEN